jgi:hypothetical protein
MPPERNRPSKRVRFAGKHPPGQSPLPERVLLHPGSRRGADQVKNSRRLRVGATYAGKILTVHVEDTHFRVTCDGTEISLHPGPDSAPSRSGKPRSTPRRPNACPATPESVKPCDELKMSSKS